MCHIRQSLPHQKNHTNIKHFAIFSDGVQSNLLSKIEKNMLNHLNHPTRQISGHQIESWL